MERRGEGLEGANGWEMGDWEGLGEGVIVWLYVCARARVIVCVCACAFGRVCVCACLRGEVDAAAVPGVLRLEHVPRRSRPHGRVRLRSAHLALEPYTAVPPIPNPQPSTLNPFSAQLPCSIRPEF